VQDCLKCESSVRVGRGLGWMRMDREEMVGTFFVLKKVVIVRW
jgi:hypothetical protein